MSYLPKVVKQGGRSFKNPFYQSQEWRKCRNAYIKEHPYCQECERHNRLTLGRDVDHIKPINPRNAYDTKGGYYGDPLNWDNLQTLCVSCHASKSGKERRS